MRERERERERQRDPKPMHQVSGQHSGHPHTTTCIPPCKIFSHAACDWRPRPHMLSSCSGGGRGIKASQSAEEVPMVVAMSISALGRTSRKIDLGAESTTQEDDTVELYCSRRTVCWERTLMECLGKSLDKVCMISLGTCSGGSKMR
jgi:hypothetical protein